MNDKPVYLHGNGTGEREWIYITDLCVAIIRALFYGKPGETYNIGNGKPVKDLELAEKVLSLSGKPQDRIHPCHDVTDRSWGSNRLNVYKANCNLAWCSKYSLEEGLAETIEWYRENLNRLASNSLLEGLVFGYKIGKQINSFLEEAKTEKVQLNINYSTDRKKKDIDASILISEIQQEMTENVGIIRNKEGLMQALKKINSYAELLEDAKCETLKEFELQNIVLISRLVIESALEREESNQYLPVYLQNHIAAVQPRSIFLHLSRLILKKVRVQNRHQHKVSQYMLLCIHSFEERRQLQKYSFHLQV